MAKEAERISSVFREGEVGLIFIDLGFIGVSHLGPLIGEKASAGGEVVGFIGVSHFRGPIGWISGYGEVSIQGLKSMVL